MSTGIYGPPSLKERSVDTPFDGGELAETRLEVARIACAKQAITALIIGGASLGRKHENMLWADYLERDVGAGCRRLPRDG